MYSAHGLLERPATTRPAGRAGVSVAALGAPSYPLGRPSGLPLLPQSCRHSSGPMQLTQHCGWVAQAAAPTSGAPLCFHTSGREML